VKEISKEAWMLESEGY